MSVASRAVTQVCSREYSCAAGLLGGGAHLALQPSTRTEVAAAATADYMGSAAVRLLQLCPAKQLQAYTGGLYQGFWSSK
jgi:hypothetical protein